MAQPLNWREIAEHARWIQKNLTRARVENIIVPARPELSQGFQLNEWGIRLSGPAFFLFGLRPRSPYCAYKKTKGPKVAAKGSHTVFSLKLQKELKGLVFSEIEAIPGDRVIVCWFSRRRRGLVLHLFPAASDAFLIDSNRKILASHRGKTTGKLSLRPPKDQASVKVRLEDFSQYYDLLQKDFIAEAKKTIGSAKDETDKKHEKALAQTRKALENAKKEPNWKQYGELLKAHLHEFPKFDSPKITLEDFSTGERISLTVNPKRSPAEQVAEFFKKAKRKERRIAETLERLKKLEKGPSTPAKKPVAPVTGWKGHTFESVNGFTILAGRNRKENQELTFKIARGRDLWFHVRGKPSAHVVVLLKDQNLPPHETLLDAAWITIVVSGGRDWGKTEVDYTPRKNVRRIKGSQEVSYRGNKTLMVGYDSKRHQRLLDK